jgi:BirA family biotin operon repressor/biotin-[acetyl-CoA-carboxylase] ligase
MLALAGQGASEGLWLRADSQTGGRGRLNRDWESPEGNLYSSTLIRLQADDPPAPTLALVAAVAVWQAIDSVLPGRARIKWPNDIMIGSAKLSGMLLERSGDAVVLGIGVNIMAHPANLPRPTTSLWAQGAVECTAACLLETLADRFAALLLSWRTYGLGPIRSAWIAAAHPPGTPLHISLPDGEALDGQFQDMDDGGALILRLADGGVRAIHAGDVFLV